MMTNYFDVLNIEPAFILDEAELRKSFYELSLEYHPDRYGLKSEEEQMEALQKSTLINTAFKILSDKYSRMRHLLEITGIEFAEGNESVPQEFLAELMDINELIMDYKLDPDQKIKENILTQISSLNSNLLNTVDEILTNFEIQKADKKQLELIKDYYLKCKYLKRIELNLEN